MGRVSLRDGHAEQAEFAWYPRRKSLRRWQGLDVFRQGNRRLYTFGRRRPNAALIFTRMQPGSAVYVICCIRDLLHMRRAPRSFGWRGALDRSWPYGRNGWIDQYLR